MAVSVLGCSKYDLCCSLQDLLVGCSPWGHEESARDRSLVGCRLWGHTESDTTDVTQQQQHLVKGGDKDDSQVSSLYNQLVMSFFEVNQVWGEDNLTQIHAYEKYQNSHKPAILPVRVYALWKIQQHFGSRKIFSFNMYGQQRQDRDDRKKGIG